MEGNSQLKAKFWPAKLCIFCQANATGHSAKTVLEFLEKYYTTEEVASERGAVKLAIRALLEVVQSGLKNLEVAVMRKNAPLEVSFYINNIFAW